jgi:hypothetical protein
MSYSKNCVSFVETDSSFLYSQEPTKSEALCEFLKFRVISPSSKSQLPHLSQLLSQHPVSNSAYLKSVFSVPTWVRVMMWSHCTHFSLLY